MKLRNKHIIILLTGLLQLVLNYYSIQAQRPLYHIEIPQCNSYTFAVDKWPGDRYTWDLYHYNKLNFAKENGNIDPAGYFKDQMYEGSSVTVNWLDTGRYILRVMVWDEVHCSNNLVLFSIKVTPNLPTLVFEGDSVCEDEVAYLKVVFTGMAPWEASYAYTFENQRMILNMSGETNEEIIMAIPRLSVGRHEYWVMEVTDQCTVHSYPQPNPEKGIIQIFRRPTSQRINVKNK